MKQKDFTVSILTERSPAEVYNAVNNVSGWWQGEIAGITEKLNDEFTYKVGTVHFSKQKVVEMQQNIKVVWLITESNLSFADRKDEWTGTKVQFDISSEGDSTKLTFTHYGLVPIFQCYEACSNAWELLIQKSLFSFISTGKGVDVF